MASVSNHEGLVGETRVKTTTADGATIYILLCADGSYYTGLTHKDLGERVSEHNNGTFPGFTSKRRPMRVVYASQFDRITDAIAAERR